MKRLSLEQLQDIQKKSNIARGNILKMTTLSKSGHPGGSMSTIDFLMTLYHMINIDPKNPKMKNRDRVVMSHGHVSPAVYTTLGEMGFFDIDDAIAQFRLADSIFEGHVEPDVPGVELASGNLGQGLSAGCGFALSARQNGIENNIFVLMGDGEQQKGQISEARRFSVKYNLNNIVAFIDYNQLQIGGDINDVMPQHILHNYLADGWDVIEIDGHNFEEIHNAIIDATENDEPTVIIAKTVMGKGVSFMENKEKYHGSTISEEQLTAALQELNLENNFDKYKKMRAKFTQKPKLYTCKCGKDFPIKTGKPIVYSEKTDCRSAWGNAIADIAKINGEKAPLAVFDCDLMGSVKTDGFHKILPQNFYQSGIMEHHTATTAGAMSMDNILTYFADFGVFGIDETFNMHRLSDINETNLRIITTHVGLDVGEDGKTHQCIDYLGLMKNLYHFKTIVPADPNQTDHIIRYITGKYGNFVVPMGRSKLNIIRDESDIIFFDENYKFTFGKADLLRDGTDAALFVMGTLTNRAIEIVEKLKKEGISIQLWNVSCPTKLDEDALKMATKTGTIFTYEDHNVNTGLGNSIADKMMQLGLSAKFVKFGVEDYAISGTADDVFKHCKLDVNSILERIKKIL